MKLQCTKTHGTLRCKINQFYTVVCRLAEQHVLIAHLGLKLGHPTCNISSSEFAIAPSFGGYLPRVENCILIPLFSLCHACLCLGASRQPNNHPFVLLHCPFFLSRQMCPIPKLGGRKCTSSRQDRYHVRKGSILNLIGFKRSLVRTDMNK